MNFKQNFAENIKRVFSSVDIVNVYNTHIYGSYKNVLKEDSRDMHCLLITLEGQGEINLKDGTKNIIAMNNMYFGNIKNIKSLSSCNKHWHFILYWFFTLNLKLPENKTIYTKSFNLNEVEEQCDFMLELVQTRVESKVFYANNLLYNFIYNIIETLNPYSQKSDQLIQEIIKYINAHIYEQLQIENISKEFGYCAKHIRYLFKTALNTTPKHYITKVKLEHIAQILCSSDIPIQELAENFSFNSSGHLTNSFKQEYKVSPRKYRQIHKSDNI